MLHLNNLSYIRMFSGRYNLTPWNATRGPWSFVHVQLVPRIDRYLDHEQVLPFRQLPELVCTGSPSSMICFILISFSSEGFLYMKL